MLDNRYVFQARPDYATFGFESVGPNGRIMKAVRYTKINEESLYNLAFGDFDPATGDLDDLVVSNNGDLPKILNTVAATVYVFTTHYPAAAIFATGSTAARTRLYRMGLANNLTEIETDFVVLGLLAGGWQAFRKDVTYQGCVP